MSELHVTLNTGGEKGEKGDKGDRGDVGPRGMTGTGQRGPQGERGPQGYGLGVRGVVDGVGDLPTNGSPGDGWLVKTSEDDQGILYIWSGSAWVSIGPISGPQGEDGPQGIQGLQGPAWINWRNQWLNGTSYNVGDGVFYISPSNSEGWTLRCSIAHTSGQNFNMANWDIILVSVPGPQGIQGLPGVDGSNGQPGLNGPEWVNFRNEWTALPAGTPVAVRDSFFIVLELTSTLTYYMTIRCHTAHNLPALEDRNYAYIVNNYQIIIMSAPGPQGIQGIQGEQGQPGQAGVNANMIAFTSETEYNAYQPQFNELVGLFNA